PPASSTRSTGATPGWSRRSAGSAGSVAGWPGRCVPGAGPGGRRRDARPLPRPPAPRPAASTGPARGPGWPPRRGGTGARRNCVSTWRCAQKKVHSATFIPTFLGLGVPVGQMVCPSGPRWPGSRAKGFGGYHDANDGGARRGSRDVSDPEEGPMTITPSDATPASFETRFTRLVGCRLPIQSAPMAGVVSDAKLPAAVAAAGGHGMFPALFLSAPYLTRVLSDLSGRTRAYGVNFIGLMLDRECLEIAAGHAPLVELFLAEPSREI